MKIWQNIMEFQYLSILWFKLQRISSIAENCKIVVSSKPILDHIDITRTLYVSNLLFFRKLTMKITKIEVYQCDLPLVSKHLIKYSFLSHYGTLFFCRFPFFLTFLSGWPLAYTRPLRQTDLSRIFHLHSGGFSMLYFLLNFN